MPVEDKQIDTNPKKEEKKPDKKEESMKDDKGKPLTEADIAMIKRYGKGPYHENIKNVEADIKSYSTKITQLCGIKESDFGESLPAQWNLEADAMLAKESPPLQVGRCTKILNKGQEDAKYIV